MKMHSGNTRKAIIRLAAANATPHVIARTSSRTKMSSELNPVARS
jgi:hypothetical protein